MVPRRPNVVEDACEGDPLLAVEGKFHFGQLLVEAGHDLELVKHRLVLLEQWVFLAECGFEPVVVGLAVAGIDDPRRALAGCLGRGRAGLRWSPRLQRGLSSRSSKSSENSGSFCGVRNVRLRSRGWGRGLLASAEASAGILAGGMGREGAGLGQYRGSRGQREGGGQVLAKGGKSRGFARLLGGCKEQHQNGGGMLHGSRIMICSVQ